MPDPKHYSYDDLLALASEPDEHGWRSTTIEVKDGETACHPASTKHVLHGPMRVRYDIHPMGIHTTVLADE